MKKKGYCMSVVFDMDGNKLAVGDSVLRYSTRKKEGNHLLRTISCIGAMYDGGEMMVWFKEGGSAHHPLACLKVESQK